MGFPPSSGLDSKLSGAVPGRDGRATAAAAAASILLLRIMRMMKKRPRPTIASPPTTPTTAPAIKGTLGVLEAVVVLVFAAPLPLDVLRLGFPLLPPPPEFVGLLPVGDDSAMDSETPDGVTRPRAALQ